MELLAMRIINHLLLINALIREISRNICSGISKFKDAVWIEFQCTRYIDWVSSKL